MSFVNEKHFYLLKSHSCMTFQKSRLQTSEKTLFKNAFRYPNKSFSLLGFWEAKTGPYTLFIVSNEKFPPPPNFWKKLRIQINEGDERISPSFSFFVLRLLHISSWFFILAAFWFFFWNFVANGDGFLQVKNRIWFQVFFNCSSFYFYLLLAIIIVDRLYSIGLCRISCLYLGFLNDIYV